MFVHEYYVLATRLHSLYLVLRPIAKAVSHFENQVGAVKSWLRRLNPCLRPAMRHGAKLLFH